MKKEIEKGIIAFYVGKGPKTQQNQTIRRVWFQKKITDQTWNLDKPQGWFQKNKF